jgi:hypothetical protein
MSRFTITSTASAAVADERKFHPRDCYVVGLLSTSKLMRPSKAEIASRSLSLAISRSLQFTGEPLLKLPENKKFLEELTVYSPVSLSQSQSYFTTGGLPPISSSWRQAP